MRCRNPFLAFALSALVFSSGFCLLWAEPAQSPTPGQGASGAGNSATPAQAAAPAHLALRLRSQHRGKALS